MWNIIISEYGFTGEKSEALEFEMPVEKHAPCKMGTRM